MSKAKTSTSTSPCASLAPAPQGKTYPEELFAAGYGTCFQSVMSACAGQPGLKISMTWEDRVAEAAVRLVGDMKA